MGIQPIAGVAREDQVVLSQADEKQDSLLAQSLKKEEEHTATLTEMIKDAREKADAQREKFKLAKVTPRYGDAPLEAYARLSRAKNQAQVSSAAGYARRRLVQLQAAQRTDPDHADQIKAAINQLKKAVGRAGKKKLELNREQLARARQKRMIQEKNRREEQRIRQELRRSQSMRAVRESGYFREAQIENRFADQLSAAKMELRAQAQQLGAAVYKSVDAAVQEYSAAVQTADVDASACVPQVDVQA